MMLKRLFQRKKSVWILIVFFTGAILFTVYYNHALVNLYAKKRERRISTRISLQKSRTQTLPLLNIVQRALRNVTLSDTFKRQTSTSSFITKLTTTTPVSSKGTVRGLNQTELPVLRLSLNSSQQISNNALQSNKETSQQQHNWLTKLQSEKRNAFESTSTAEPQNLFHSKDTERKNYSGLNNLAGLTLHVRMTASKKDLYEKLLVTGMRYFWIFDTPIVAVLDSTEADVAYGKEIQKKYPFPKICHERKFKVPAYRNNGHKLQQMKLFLVDECIDNKFVGFVDTDTLFATVVTADLLFDEGKPIIIAQYGKWADNFWRRTSETTKFILGKAEVFKCMTYFPIIFHVKHIVEFRHYLENKHKMDIISLFKVMLNREFFSEYNLICNYLWYFHRDEYKFHAQLRVENGVWHGEQNPEGRVGLEYYSQYITREISYPMPRSGIHYRHLPAYTERKTYMRILKAGLCFSGGFDYCPEKCQAFNRSSLHSELYNFEWSNWTWDSRCIDAQRKHYGILDRSRTPQIRKRIKIGCEEIDNLPFSLKPAPYQ